ncbi:MAG: NAD(P)/FAD-dependent oxidoreductase [Eubacteriales bacterium]
MTDIIIIGAGPAGLTAAVYALRAGKSVLVLEKGSFGGQMTFSPKIENFPGFTQISGTELADRLVEQALAQGAEIDIEEVTGIRHAPQGGGFVVVTDSGEHECRAVIVATGAKHRRLDVPGEDAYIGDGISFCAICDGAFYAGKHVAVIGGGNSALQEALLLAETAEKVTILQNLPTFTGEQKLIDAVNAASNIEAHFSVTVKEFYGDSEIRGAVVENAVTGEQFRVEADGFFEAIGLMPDNEPFADMLTLERGYVRAGEDCTTGTPGIFTAGDCRTKRIRQIATAAADGAVAALAACDFLA